LNIIRTIFLFYKKQLNMKSTLDLTADEFRVLCYLKTVRVPKSLKSIGYAVKAYKDDKAIEFAEENTKNLVGNNLIFEVNTEEEGIKYEAYLSESEEVKSVLSWEKTRPTNDPLEKGTKVSFKPHSLSPAMKRDGIEEQEGYVLNWHFNEEYKRYVNIAPIDFDGNIIRKKIWKRDRALTILEMPNDETNALIDEALKRPKRIFKKRDKAKEDSHIISMDDYSFDDINQEDVSLDINEIDNF
jgi:hypothetical protein